VWLIINTFLLVSPASTQIGAVIYARVVLANKDMEPELSCISTQYKKEWMTGQAVFGEVNGGYMFECSTALCHQYGL
jgi:exosome complex component RRP40